MELTGVVYNIQRFSLHDGPGIRTVVFLKGCPLHCLWCSNPESQEPEPQLLYQSALCIHCGRCAAVCPEGAIELREDGNKLLYERCTLCGTCAAACPTEALSVKGKRMTAGQVMEEVERDRIFYRREGGMTVSGGEPFQQTAFLLEILKRTKERGITTAIETCGFTAWENIRQSVALTDHYLYDLKCFDDDRHRANTGVSNALILKNLARLAELASSIVVRIPLIPGYNDDAQQLLALAAFIRGIGTLPVHILPYHNYGETKYHALNRPYPIPDDALDKSEQAAHDAAEFLRGQGLDVTIGG